MVGREINEGHAPDVSPAQGPEWVDLVHLGHVQQLVHVHAQAHENMGRA